MGCQSGKPGRNKDQKQGENFGFSKQQTMHAGKQNVETGGEGIQEQWRSGGSNEILSADKGKQKEATHAGDNTKDDGSKKDGSEKAPLKYTFTLNGKSLAHGDEGEEMQKQEPTQSDLLNTTDIREGNTPQLSEEDEFNQIDRIYDKKDITLADLGDGMVFEPTLEKKMTLHKAATLKKSATLKKKLEQKLIIHVLEVQPLDSYFHPQLSKQFTRQNSPKAYNKSTTLFVPAQ